MRKTVIEELTQLNSTHDVILVLIDSAFAYEMPPVSSGWVEAFDVETGRSRVMSRRIAPRARRAGARVAGRGAADGEGGRTRRAAPRPRRDRERDALSEFVAERRLRKS